MALCDRPLDPRRRWARTGCSSSCRKRTSSGTEDSVCLEREIVFSIHALTSSRPSSSRAQLVPQLAAVDGALLAWFASSASASAWAGSEAIVGRQVSEVHGHGQHPTQTL